MYSKGLILNFCIVDGSSERGEKDASKITTYPPGAVRFDCELRAVQVSCGFHHSGGLISFTRILRRKSNQDALIFLFFLCGQINILFLFAVVLMENGDVYTFGYGQHGQLGHGDVNSRYVWGKNTLTCPSSVHGRR